ncbi:hypothetical protein MYX84_01440 [Acidobacteria bacterium AH-259-O06]|nr:hypothetical protein [Acidobacteria bacterium AH-259-O06]
MKYTKGMSAAIAAVTLISFSTDHVVHAKQTPPCSFHVERQKMVLTNGLCRIRWTASKRGWIGQYERFVVDDWKTLALDDVPEGAAYEVLELPGEPDYAAFQDRFVVGHYPEVQTVRLSTLPPLNTKPEAVYSSPEYIEIVWKFPILDKGREAWQVVTSFSIRRDTYHIQETVRFERRRGGHGVRVRRGWHIKDIPKALRSSIVQSLTHRGWRLREGTFLVAATHDPDKPWTPYSGGGGLVRLGGRGLSERKIDPTPNYRMYHQAPPSLENDGWIELRKGEVYTLQHYIITHPVYPFKRAFIDYFHKLQPLEQLRPRYSWRYFIDKCMWTLRYTPGVYIDGGQWGHYYKNWYSLNRRPHIEKVTSLDWGASWDIWNAYFLLLYGQRYKDKWALERYHKLHNGIVMNDWQIERPGRLMDGAIWMERDEEGNFHISNWMRKENPRTLWVCDAAKVGYFLCLLYERTRDEVLLDKARRAGAFLLRLQQDSGDLLGSIVSEEGEVRAPSNLGGTVSPIMLWAKLYEITGDVKYLRAARQTADFCLRTWLSNDQWQMFGGEIDSFYLADSTSAMYAVMSFAALTLAGGGEKYCQATADAANYLVSQQWLFDINYGYYRRKARWNGTDFKTAGSLQGWIRPECIFSMYMAWKATGDSLYRYSMEQHAAWMTYMQYDNRESPRTFGGGSEALQSSTDVLNGFGSNFFPETVGQAIALIELMQDDDDAAQVKRE